MRKSIGILTPVIILLPKLASACPNHDFHLGGSLPTSVVDLLFTLVFLLIVATPLGFGAGRIMRGLLPATKILILGLAATGLLMAGDQKAWACHGVDTVLPVLEEVYAAQHSYHAQHGVYAASFKDLGIAPASNEYSLFLPSERLVVKNPSPKQGVDLSRLPNGVTPFASADMFTVVAIAFTEPNRIYVWTMNHKKDFREWSVPAVEDVKPMAQENQPSAHEWVSQDLIQQLEGPAMMMTFLLGLGIGLMLAMRSPVASQEASV